jgi:hypothetical protein
MYRKCHRQHPAQRLGVTRQFDSQNLSAREFLAESAADIVVAHLVQVSLLVRRSAQPSAPSAKGVAQNLVHSVLTHPALSHPLLDEPVQECGPQGEHLGAALRFLRGLPFDLTDAVRAVRVVTMVTA